MLFAFVVLNILTIAYAQPYGYNPKNTVTVPPNCPIGQSWINRACRDDWFRAATILIPEWKLSDILSSKLISIPPNCPPGQEYSNGVCRDTWRGGDLPNSLLFSQQLENLWNDYVRKVQQTRVQMEEDSDYVAENSNYVANKAPRRITDIPKQCPIGYGFDARGHCRPQI